MRMRSTCCILRVLRTANCQLSSVPCIRPQAVITGYDIQHVVRADMLDML